MKGPFVRSLKVCLFLGGVLCLMPFSQAQAFSLKLESSGGANLLIADNGPGDNDPTVGAINFNGAVVPFASVTAIGITKPIIGTDDLAKMTLNVVVSTGNAGGSLKSSLTETDYFVGAAGGQEPLVSFVGGTNGLTGMTTFQSFVDTDNMEFATSGVSVCTPGAQGPFGPGAFNNSTSQDCVLNGQISLTAVAETSLGANDVQSFGSDISITRPPDTQEPLACRFTGGGVDTDNNWDGTLEDGSMQRGNGAGNLPAGIDRYTFGGQVGARTAQQPQPSGEWQHHQQTGPSGSFGFHGGTNSAAEGTRIVDVRCSDPGFCAQARPAPAKQLDFDAIGTFSNIGKGQKAPVFEIPSPNVIPEPNGGKNKEFTFHWFEVNIDDLGEPGKFNNGAPNSVTCPGRGFGEKSGGPFVPDPVNAPGTTVILPTTELANCDCPDFYRITVYKGVLNTEVTFLPDGRIDPTSMNKSDVIYESFGFVDGGNLQLHPPTGFDSN